MTASARRKTTCPFKPPSSGGGAIQASGGWLCDESVIATHHVAFDDGLGTALASFLGTSSVYDIGAGVGQLQRLLKKKESPVDYAGFDGGDNIESMWGKTTPVRGDPYHVVPEICWVDAAAPVSLVKSRPEVAAVQLRGAQTPLLRLCRLCRLSIARDQRL
eukprot:CAMPEP_0180304222 /NCGR_PEP_ID=MMETSP0988-20121125/25630_1 /TAXON_ID=697907 /ORGANISM="non described non described, Strain CCMP2293" /LENGTH=160 /DNA_ID=CAMNT_0022286279 /DNA_START=95 /DNA_END=574 /DNA_ORIENTATION=-